MRIDELLLHKNTNVLICAPANPINTQAKDNIATAVGKIKGISEAHLPQFSAPELSEFPAQVLVLVLTRWATPDGVMTQLGPELHKIIPKGIYLDVLPIESTHELVTPVRSAGCQIYKSNLKPWWKFW